jgi:hypothetical protein
MPTHFFNNDYYYPDYYPGYKENKFQDNNFISQYQYIKNEQSENPDINTQVFYNTTDNNEIPWGSTYKYTIPKSIDDILSSNNNSISRKQKRVGFEGFANTNNSNIPIYIIIVIIILFIVCKK